MKASTLLLFAKKINHAYARLCEPLLQEFHLPQVSFDILMFLANNPEYKTAQEISELRHIKKNLVSVHAEKLVSAGYLVRSPIEGDRRKIGLTCTEKAMPIVDAGREMQSNLFRLLSKDISANELELYQRILEKIISNAHALL